MIFKAEHMRYIAIPLMLFMLCLCGIQARASEISETLTVDEVRLAGELITIKVTDAAGIQSEIEFNLRDYEDGSEYISLNAVDRNGNQSNVVRLKNPYYTPPSETETPAANPDITVTPEQSESAIPGNSNSGVNLRPFTPDGTGTVVDNVNDGDGKEFFSIQTEDGNVFYLIVDRHRTSDNVYLLNAVTEDELIPLTKDGGGLPGSMPGAIPAEIPQTTAEPETTPGTSGGVPPASGQSETPKKPGNSNIIIIGIIALAVGAAAYYLKIVRPKQQSGNIDNFREEAEETDDYLFEDPDEGEYDDDEFESMADDEDGDNDDTDEGADED